MAFSSNAARILLRALLGGMASLLVACASQVTIPPHGVPEPAPELAAARTLIQGQYAALNQMACLSEAAYGLDPNRPDPSCAQFEQGPGIKLIPRTVALQDPSGKPYQGSYTIIVDNQQHQQIIAVRGSANINDWLTDLRFDPVFDNILQVTVHQGFQLYARAVLQDLLQNGGLNQLNAGYDTYFTGHSLGGAVAVLLGHYFYVGYPNLIALKGVYTFGQPKVFDNHGATSWPDFAQSIYRAENCFDPVPLVPIGKNIIDTLIVDPLSSRSEAAQYEHVGHEVELLGNGGYWVPGANELVRSTVREADAVLKALRAGAPTDHDIGLYIANIRSLDRGGGLGYPTNPAYRFGETCSYRPAVS
jgi:lipase (class 3)